MGSDYPVGFAAAAIAIAFFGTNFIPVKQYNTGDGMFFQWCMCAGVFVTGLFYQFFTNATSPTFYPLACVGGILWCTGNITAVPVIQCIGLGLGMLLWGGSNMLVGWACSFFGILEKASTPNIVWLNVLGVVVCLGAMSALFFIRPSADEDHNDKMNQLINIDPHSGLASSSSLDASLLEHALGSNGSSNGGSGASDDGDSAPAPGGKSMFEKLPPTTRRLVGIAGALLAGLFYGTNFTPPQIEADNKGVGIEHMIFSHFCGVFLTSTVYFMIYCVATNNKPDIRANIALPSFISGVMWSIAQISFFFANADIGETAAFPLISTGPGIVATLCGVFMFKEIQGRRNMFVLAGAIMLSVIGVTCITISKVG